jgi:hypothetical protein
MDREKKLNTQNNRTPLYAGTESHRTRTDISSLKGLVSIKKVKTRVDRSISSLSGPKELRVHGSLQYTRIRYKVSLYQRVLSYECEDSLILIYQSIHVHELG